MLKKIKFCFKKADYGNHSTNNTIFVIFDKSRGYYGVKFSTDDSDVKYGKVICSNSGNEYDNYYFERTFYSWCFYHRHPSWIKEHKSTLFNFYKFIVKVPVDSLVTNV